MLLHRIWLYMKWWMESICIIFFFSVSKTSLCHQLLLSTPSSLVQHVLGHYKQLTRAEKSSWFVSHRHLAFVHFQACRFRQMALEFKHGFLDSGVSKLWKGICDCSTFKWFLTLPFPPLVLSEQILSVPPSKVFLHPFFLWIAFTTSLVQSFIFRPKGWL